MNDFERRYLQLAANTEARARRNNVGNHFGQTATKVRRLEDVLEDAFDIDQRSFVRKDAERSETKVQRPNVIETKNVIGMTVSNQNCIEMFQTKSQCLLSKIGGGVDEYGAAGMFDDD